MIDSIAPDERRRFPRAPLAILVQYRFNTLEDFLAEYSVDISFGGMFLRTNDPREKGTMVYFQFTLKDGSRIIEGLGRVVHVNLPPTKPDEIAGMGIEFVSLDDPSKKVIEQIVQRNLARGQV